MLGLSKLPGILDIGEPALPGVSYERSSYRDAVCILPPIRIYLAELGCKANKEVSHCNLIVGASQEFEEQEAIYADGQEQLHSSESLLEATRIIL